MNKKEVEIRIVTNGHFTGTRIYVDGEEWLVKEINFSASVPHRAHGKLVGGRCNLQVQREVGGKILPINFYGDAFEKIAEARELQEDNDGTKKDDGVSGN